VRHVGHLPRIFTWCTVNKIQNLWRGYSNISQVLFCNFLKTFFVDHRHLNSTPVQNITGVTHLVFLDNLPLMVCCILFRMSVICVGMIYERIHMFYCTTLSYILVQKHTLYLFSVRFFFSAYRSICSTALLKSSLINFPVILFILSDVFIGLIYTNCTWEINSPFFYQLSLSKISGLTKWILYLVFGLDKNSTNTYFSPVFLKIFLLQSDLPFLPCNC
jgi:hypothetical protein